MAASLSVRVDIPAADSSDLFCQESDPTYALLRTLEKAIPSLA
jgi:hypothetical protein